MLPYTNRARDADKKEAYELSRSLTYDLMSVVVHVGEIDTGHYISYCLVGEQVSLPSKQSNSVGISDTNKIIEVVHLQRSSR